MDAQIAKVIDRLVPQQMAVFVLSSSVRVTYFVSAWEREIPSLDGRTVYRWDGEERDEKGRRVYRWIK